MADVVSGTVPFGCGLAQLIAVRHGESTANAVFARAVATGDAELSVSEGVDAQVRLSALGERQAAALGQWLAALPAGEQPELVVCSPYVRAVRTWQVMRAEAGAAGASYGPALVDERLRDREMGVLELMTPPAVRAYAAVEADRRERVGEWYYRPPGGESSADVVLRIRDFLTELGAGAAGRRVLVVAHDVVVLAVQRVLAGIGGARPEGAEAAVPNGSVSSWVRDGGGGGLRPEVFGGTAHLAGVAAS